MIAANRVHVEKHPDHFILRFALSMSPDREAPGEDVATIMLPISAGALLGVEMFEGMMGATQTLNAYFLALGPRIEALNRLSDHAKPAGGAAEVPE